MTASIEPACIPIQMDKTMNSTTRLTRVLLVAAVVAALAFLAFSWWTSNGAAPQTAGNQNAPTQEAQGPENGQTPPGERGGDPSQRSEEREPDEDFEPPTTAQLYKTVLPRTSPAWCWVDLDRWNNASESFDDFWQEASVERFVQQAASALPKGATPVYEKLMSQSQSMRLYMVPPAEGQYYASYIAAFAQPGADSAALQEQIEAPFASTYPDAATREIEAGPVDIQVLGNEQNEIAYFFDQGLIWVTMQSDALASLFRIPAPAENDEPPAYEKFIQAHPDALAAIFLNAASPELSRLGTPGWFPRWLSEMGVRDTSILLHFPEGSGRLVAEAAALRTPDWAESWSPLENHTFQSSDPAGLIEISMRWPSSESVSPATEEARPQRNELPAPQARRQDGNNERPQRGRDPQQLGNGESPRRGDSSAMRTRGGIMQMGRGSFFSLLDTISPPNHPMGLNFFGFRDQKPAITLAFPRMPENNSFLDRLEQIPWVESERIEIAKLPGSFYRFGDTPLARGLGISNLLVIERDYVTYFFDSELVAANYLGEVNQDPAGKERRDISLRDNLEDTQTPAQIKAVASRDLFLWLMRNEQDRYDPDSQAFQELQDLIDTLQNYWRPMAVHAGFDAEESKWFLEAVTDDEPALIVDTLLMAFGFYRLSARL